MSSQTMAASMVGQHDREPTDHSILTISDLPLDTMSANILQSTDRQDHPSEEKAAINYLPDRGDQSQMTAINNLLAHLTRSNNIVTVERHETSTADPVLHTKTSDAGANGTIPAPAPVGFGDSDTAAQSTTPPPDTQTFNPNEALVQDPVTWFTPGLDAPYDEIVTHEPAPASMDLPQAQIPQQPDGELPDHLHESALRGRIEAFARLDFADGHYYITTYSCELGRDQRALRAAQQRAREAEDPHHSQGQASSEKASRPSKRGWKQGGSLVEGSVISSQGGFCGMDNAAAMELDEQQEQQQRNEVTKVSQSSQSSVVKPEDLELRTPIVPFDYHASAAALAAEGLDVFDDESPAPVTHEHFPTPSSNPLIPIHHMEDRGKSEIANHKAISRRHVRIAWDAHRLYFKLIVLGRNGAWLNGDYKPYNSVSILEHGSQIQVAGIVFTFKLPNAGIQPSTVASDDEEQDVSPDMNRSSTTPTSEDGARNVSPSEQDGPRTKIRIKFVKKASPPKAPLQLNAEGQPMPPKKRGPGRPPKDGIMSNRERREIAKAEKLAAARAANGGVTPPPTGRGKPNQQSANPEAPEDAKPEKRKYTKRKRAENDDVLQSIEGEDADAAAGTDDESRPVRKTRVSRSLSPEYPPKESLTEEQLTKPPDNYARLIYDILSDIHPKELSLRQIYRELKKKWPYFVHVVATDGWQSSVRHNLNSEYAKLFGKGGKEGKGYTWHAIPGAMEPKEELERKRKAQAAAAEAKAKASSAPNGQRYPLPGAARQGPWQPQGQMFPYQGMPPNGSGPPPVFYGSPPNGLPWPPPYPNGPPPGQMHPPPAMGTGPAPTGLPGRPNQQGVPYPGPPYPPPPQFWSPHPPPNRSPQTGPATSTSQSPHPPQAPPTTSTPPTHDPFMRCTPLGMSRIASVENAMLGASTTEAERQLMTRVIEAVRARVFGDVAETGLPPDNKQAQDVFKVLLGHTETILRENPNPAYLPKRKDGQVAGIESSQGVKAEGIEEVPAEAAAGVIAEVEPDIGKDTGSSAGGDRSITPS